MKASSWSPRSGRVRLTAPRLIVHLHGGYRLIIRVLSRRWGDVFGARHLCISPWVRALNVVVECVCILFACVGAGALSIKRG